ncbi:MAG: PqqD family protein [Candidatus Marinimicrobia bacterium]|nr:PqqD family protein [Candidatus Neomarinimicrobiota bacterium]
MSEIFKSEVTLSENGFLFDHGSGLTYTLNTTGQFIFRQLQSGQKSKQIMEKMLDEFEVIEETARKDLDDFFRQLNELGLIDL